MIYITKNQLNEIIKSSYNSIEEFHHKLELYTGIKARTRAKYEYFDFDGEYIGDSNYSLEELLELAYIEVIDNV